MPVVYAERMAEVGTWKGGLEWLVVGLGGCFEAVQPYAIYGTSPTRRCPPSTLGTITIRRQHCGNEPVFKQFGYSTHHVALLSRTAARFRLSPGVGKRELRVSEEVAMS